MPMDLPNVPWTDWLHFPLPEPEPANKKFIEMQSFY